MNRAITFAAAAFGLLFVAACGTSGMGDIFGGSNDQIYDIRGTVDYVDINSQSIYLTRVDGYADKLAGTGGGGTARVYYDDQTPVTFQGENFRPQDLERGDEVSIRAGQSSTGGELIAESIYVTYNSRDGTTSSGGNDDPSDATIRGTVRSIDTYNRTIALDSTSWVSGFKPSAVGNTITVQYDTGTRVEYQGQLHPITNLERGDLVDVQMTYSSGSNYSAQRITLVRDVNR